VPERLATKAFPEACAALVAARGSRPDRDRLHDLFDLAWARRMQESPEAATFDGVPGYNHLWTDDSAEAIARRKREAGEPLAVLESIDRTALDETDATSFDLFAYNTSLAVEGARFPSELLCLDQMSGVQQDAAMVLSAMPTDRIDQLRDVVARIRALPAVVEQHTELLRSGLRQGVTPPRVTMRDVPDQVRSQMAAADESHPLLAVFEQASPLLDTRDVRRLRDEAAASIRDDVIPSFERLLSFLEAEYIPGCRESVAAGDLPDGADWYRHRVRAYTTTEMTPEEIHELGLSEVARIRAEMESVIGKTGFKGDFAEFIAFLRTDPQFFFTSADELLGAYRDIAKRIDPELCKLFGTLPRLPYGVTPVPAYAEKSQTTAYYLPGSPDAGRPGWFFANTYDLPSRPRWEMEALTLHEAVPGHHLQISIAQELTGLPEFRRLWGNYTAYVEGWGLYAESLGEELGLYRDPYSRFGQLVYEMWRAIRLVVDTGMHALGWSRRRAIDFFTENAGKAEHDIVVEVDRYIVMPGQALAYKLGELKLRELRAAAVAGFGEAFDVRAFHDRVLGQGALPLAVLDAQVRSWISDTGAGGAR